MSATDIPATVEPDHAALAAVVARFPAVVRGGDLGVCRMSGGLINDTFAVGARYVLQRLHPVFGAKVNLDIAALGQILRQRGVPVPAIERADDGAPWIEVADGPTRGVWRVLERLPGLSYAKVERPARAASGAALVARFHGALAGVEHRFAFERPGAHDTALHIAKMHVALDAHRGHRLYEDVAALCPRIDALWRVIGPAPALPRRIVHGDLKISNLLFVGDEAVALIDLDTMAWMGLDAELGDALRSWCNLAREDELAAFDEGIFAAALHGYGATAAIAGGGFAAAGVTDDEREAVVHGLLRITLELSARFAGDALAEAYFGWDPSRASGRGEHNFARAAGQLALVDAVLARRSALEAIARAALAPNAIRRR